MKCHTTKPHVIHPPSGVTPSRLPERQLLLAWQHGDRAAGGELLRRHWSTVDAYFRRRVTRDHDELIQRTFVICVENRARVRETSSLRYFAIGVAKNVLRAYLREKQRMALRESVQEAPPVEAASEAAAEAAQARGRLLHALRGLSEEHQNILRLSYWDDQSSRQIGRALGLASSTVRGRIIQARAALSQRLSEAHDAPVLTASPDDLRAWAREGRSDCNSQPCRARAESRAARRVRNPGHRRYPACPQSRTLGAVVPIMAADPVHRREPARSA